MDILRHSHAKLQETAIKCALKLMDVLFTSKELVNGNPSGQTKSLDLDRKATRFPLNLDKMKYIYGESIIICSCTYLDLHSPKLINNMGI